MSFPTATYRLQFREGMDFGRAAGLAPYLQRLGVSHLYASPLFQATPGSTHGYDVTDHGVFDESLGGMDGFLRLSAALRQHGLGLILDIVPNHMAASPANPWWRDVLRHGADSRFAGHFDIDWSAPKLLVTVVGQPYGAALEAGEFSLDHDDEGLVWRYYEHAFPLDPRTWKLVLGPAGLALPEGAGEAIWPRWMAEGENARQLEEKLPSLSRDLALMHRVHEAQPWRLTYWRAARDMLTHRRFFEITDLVGVRVEDEAVFDDVHRLLFEMIADGHVSGIRVDHVDGLARPGDYLEQLRDKAPGNPPIWVEKILARDEALPEAWPVAGTTGYEFGRTLAELATDRDGAEALSVAYSAFGSRSAAYAQMLMAAKREILTKNLAAELERLTGLAFAALADDPSGRDWGPDSLRRGMVALAIALPVYRSYLGEESLAPRVEDQRILDAAGQEARQLAELDDPSPVDVLVRLLREGRGETAERFRIRFQQTTGALMAKAVEDTLFYRYNRLISSNEVGAEPDHPSLAVDAFHGEMGERLARQPGGLSTTATHDTKRGEDARMRIAAIAEAPKRWEAALGRFETLAARGDPPPPETRWLFYQALLGAWEPDDPALGERMAAYLLKAAREAKQITSWVAADEPYEERLTAFAERMIADPDFRRTFGEEVAPFVEMGGRKSLAQLALKLTAPGVPDVYQGTERADLSLVDPDNRREVDFGLRQRMLDAPEEGFDGAKMALLHHVLLLRRSSPELFAEGDYVPSDVEAPESWRTAAFLRRHQELVLAVAVEMSGQEGRGEVLMQLPASHRYELVSAWPEDGASLADPFLNMTRGFASGPATISLLRRVPRG